MTLEKEKLETKLDQWLQELGMGADSERKLGVGGGA